MLVAISVSHLESHWDVQLELPLDLADEKRRPGTKKRMVRFTVSRTRRERPLTSKRGPPNAQTERPGGARRGARELTSTKSHCKVYPVQIAYRLSVLTFYGKAHRTRRG
jgi:hypothetical protein